MAKWVNFITYWSFISAPFCALCTYTFFLTLNSNIKIMLMFFNTQMKLKLYK